MGSLTPATAQAVNMSRLNDLHIHVLVMINNFWNAIQLQLTREIYADPRLCQWISMTVSVASAYLTHNHDLQSDSSRPTQL